MLVAEGVIKPDETVVCILTGHVLKDPDVTVEYHTGQSTKKPGPPGPTSGPTPGQAREVHIPLGRSANPPIKVADNLDAILKAMGVK
jgi:threonine synthase